jgi:hypothetical protein
MLAFVPSQQERRATEVCLSLDSLLPLARLQAMKLLRGVLRLFFVPHSSKRKAFLLSSFSSEWNDSSPEGEAVVSFVESTVHSCFFSVKNKEEEAIALGALGIGFPKPLIECFGRSKKKKEDALLRGASLLESDFRDVEGAPPIAKDGVSALMQNLNQNILQSPQLSKTSNWRGSS